MLGLGADQNSVTLNGMTMGANGLPRDAGISTSLATSPFDPTRGGFSGGNLSVRSQSGSNYRSRGMSLVVNTPQLSGPTAPHRRWRQYDVSWGECGASGPLQYNKSFYNFSYQLGRQGARQPNAAHHERALAPTAGIATDSVQRFVGILQRTGMPTVAAAPRERRLSDNGSVFGSFDISPPSSTSGSSYNVTLNGNWGRQSPVGGGATQLASASGDRMLGRRHPGTAQRLLQDAARVKPSSA